MGREANCHCQWADEAGPCKVLLETHELILRGTIRRKAPIASVTQIFVRGEALHFRVGGENVVLSLGSQQAERWAKAMTTPPPTLAAKLGISSATRLLVLGEIHDAALEEALRQTTTANYEDADLMLSIARSEEDIHNTLAKHALCKNGPPLWIVYTKGAGQKLPESFIRSLMRAQDFIDTKVASVSATLTALRFLHRK